MKHKYIWELISAVFNPIFAPLWAVIIFYFLTPYPWTLGELIYTLSVIGVATIVIPTIAMIVLKAMGKINSLGLHTSAERRVPLLIVTLMLIVALKVFLIGRVSAGISLALISITISLSITYVSLIWSKISLHSMGVSGLIGMWWILCIKWSLPWEMAAIGLGILCVVYDLVVVARLELKEHTPWQIFWGSVVGFAPVVLCFLFFYKR